MSQIELHVADGLTWEDHPSVYAAKEIMPVYQLFADGMTPMEFIEDNWQYSSPGVQMQMIEYIEQYPFDGCDRYLQQWDAYLEHNKGRVLSLI